MITLAHNAIHLIISVCLTVIEAVLHVFHITLTGIERERLKQFLKFCCVGVSNSIVDFLFYALTLVILERSLVKAPTAVISEVTAVQIATICGFLTAMLNSFYWNLRYVFHKRKGEAVQLIFIKVCVVYALILLVKFGLNNLWAEIEWLPELAYNPLNQLCTVPMGYIMNKYWAYK